MKNITQQDQWNLVSNDLSNENLKLAAYDHVLVSLMGNVAGKKILDYGSGPGVLASALQRLDAKIKIYDLNPEMCQLAGEKIGEENVYQITAEIPAQYFDFVVCNLVLCIVDEEEVKSIMGNLRKAVHSSGTVYIGFCNPLIYNVLESHLDFRCPTGAAYEENHLYEKVKKEGGYKIVETHRPLEWYEKVFRAAGFSSVVQHFTPEYKLNNHHIQDFVIFELHP